MCLGLGSFLIHFITSEDDSRHIFTRVPEQEKSKAQKKSVSDYITWCNDHTVEKRFEKQKEITWEYMTEKYSWWNYQWHKVDRQVRYALQMENQQRCLYSGWNECKTWRFSDLILPLF